MAAASTAASSSISISALADSGTNAPFQPYQCTVCGNRFTRHENLKRHAALHTRPGKEGGLPCSLCSATFSRPDLRNRHIRRKHADHDPSAWPGAKRTRRPASHSNSANQPSPNADSNSAALSQASGDDDDDDYEHAGSSHAMDVPNPNATNSVLGHVHSPSLNGTSPRTVMPSSSLDGAGDYAGVGPVAAAPTAASATSANSPTLSFDIAFFFEPSNSSSMTMGLSPRSHDYGWYPSASQVDEGCSLFFTHISFFVPVLHQPTFVAANTPRHLLLAMLALGYQYGEDPDASHEQDSGIRLSLRCFHQTLGLLVSSPDTSDDDLDARLASVQAYLLLQIHAMMYQCADSSIDGLVLHTKIIALARTGGLWQPSPSATNTASAPGDLYSLWRMAMRNESHKRTMFAVHHIDALWYQLLSVSRSVSHLEFRHSLPSPVEDWAAPSSTAWAHRQLVAGYNQSSGASTVTGYTEAVRLFLSADEAGRNAIASFDAYGAVNIVQFLISSAREISGWSTMTGMLSLERIQPLKESLLALGPYIHPNPQATDNNNTTTSPAALMCEATWEIAMIELQLWSPAHTRGIVGRTIRDVLLGEGEDRNAKVSYGTSESSGSGSSARHLPTAPAAFLYDAATAEAVRPHIEWFLHYLDAARAPDLEAPWTTLYAYKAFLIAWQLLSSGEGEAFAGAMRVVGVDDGDLRGALRWARKVFQRRQRWQIGRLILRCLERL
ncbi:early growth response protein 1 (egr-1) [Ophiostoma piceae UAMH 11346]|uniref:Early growth response protein 1 (Egr-1) n=1 Tax=Ophiostoma piceae (strain UAMH 11346) TaxID=1262450 RepID=S3D4D1_OPHP1|nr:early growth response protein 1 (egr-1) [Ophiostoma piceae UAMH 11346]